MYERRLADSVRAALADTPVVLLQGARQVGKSTLARAIAAERGATYVSFDELPALAAAHENPAAYVAGFSGPAVLDEVQRVPEMFLPLKAAVDRDRRPGRFLLTGSANVLLLPRIADSLAGRMAPLSLWPLSQGEIDASPEGLLDALFADTLPPWSGPSEDRAAVVSRVLRGGFPEVVARPTARRTAWFDAYIATVLGRDVRDISRIEDLAALPRLLALLAARAAGLLNVADLARDLGMPATTLKRYLALLERTFLVQTLPAWSANLGRRLVKAPKLLITDTGLLAHLIGATADRLHSYPDLLGPLLENFVAMEIRRQAEWSAVRPRLFHFRAHSGQEVDLVLEDPAGRLVGIEVKASAAVNPAALTGLRLLQAERPRQFHRGVVLYLGRDVVAFAERLHAVPVSALWSTRGRGVRERVRRPGGKAQARA